MDLANTRTFDAVTVCIQTNLELLQLYLDGCHVTDEGIEVGHICIHVTQPLMERLIVRVKLRPLLTQ